jgi:putative DNA methylase
MRNRCGEIGGARAEIERSFPHVEISQLAEQESWRKEINRPIYHIHKWWATRLGSVFRAITLGALIPERTDIWQAFYQTHDFTGKVVLDPFMGSGTTLGEATKLGAKAIGCDINPVSAFLVRQAFTDVPESSLREAFAHLERTVAPRIQHYYRTNDPTTGEKIPVLYYFWVKTVTTPDGETIPLFSRAIYSQDAYPKKKPRAQLVCPRCLAIAEVRYDTTAHTCSACGAKFNPQAGPAAGQYVTSTRGTRFRIKDLLPRDKPPDHALYAMMALRPDGEKIYLAPTDADHKLYAEADEALETLQLPLPYTRVRPGHNTDQARGYNYTHWRDFFNSRQLLCLGLLLREIMALPDRGVREQLICLFSSTLEFNNMFCSFKGEGTGAVRHMFSNHILKPERTPLENSVWGTSKSSGTFSTLFESRLLKAKRYLHEPFELAMSSDLFGAKGASRKVVASRPIHVRLSDSWNEFARDDRGMLVMNGDSASLPIPDRSVDAVVTDPPYFDFVHYSELSDFFFAWLAPALKSTYDDFDREDSSSPGEVQQKSPERFAAQLASVFTEACRVLKDDGLLAFSFHHSRPDGWAAIYHAIEAAGMMVVAAHPVHAELRASSVKTAATSPISLDAILVCKKRSQERHRIELDAEAVCRSLEGAGMRLSINDRFVIAAAQLLIELGPEALSYAEMEMRLKTLRQAYPLRGGPAQASGSASAVGG